MPLSTLYPAWKSEQRKEGRTLRGSVPLQLLPLLVGRGGYLLSYWATWQRYKAETWVVDVLWEGYLLPFESSWLEAFLTTQQWRWLGISDSPLQQCTRENGPSSLVGVVDRISLVGATIQQVADFHLPSLRETSLHLSCEKL